MAPADFDADRMFKMSREIGALEERAKFVEAKLQGLEERVERQLAIINVKLDRLTSTDDQQLGGMRFASGMWLVFGGVIVAAVSAFITYGLK